MNAIIVCLCLLHTVNAYATTMFLGNAIIDSEQPVDNRIYKECIEPTLTRKYIFFSTNASDTNYYAVKTNWVVLHPSKIKNSLLDDGMFVFDSNPSEQCEWIENRDYDWTYDVVLVKQNATNELNVAAYHATNTSCFIEWTLVASSVPLFIGLLVIVSIIEKKNNRRNHQYRSLA